VLARELDKDLRFVSNKTTCIPFDIDTLKAYSKSMVSASRMEAKKWK